MNAGLNGSARETALLSKGSAQWPTVLLVLVGIALSLGSFLLLRAAEFSRAQAEFAAETDRWRALMQEQLTRTVESLHFISALLDSSDEVTRNEFSSFTHSILVAHPEVSSLEWLPRVTEQERDGFENRAHAEGLPSYYIKDVTEERTFINAPSRTEHYPIYYVEPFESNQDALGLDYAGRPQRFRAILQARDSGEVVATRGFDLLRGNTAADALNIIVVLPRYSPGRLPAKIEDRRARLEGFVAVVFEMSAVMQTKLGQFTPPGIAFEIRTPDRETFRLGRRGVSSSSNAAEVMPPPAYGLHTTALLELANLQFRVVARATPEFAESPNYVSAWVAFIGGLAMTALAFSYLQSLRRQFAKREELEAERERLFNLTPDLLCIAGMDGYFKQLSPAWERTLGYSRKELMSRPFISFVHPEDVANTEERLRQLAVGSDIIDFENRYRCHDGTWRWLEWRSIAAPEQDLAYASARDVTEQRETKLALERARRFAERATEVMPSVLYIDDLMEHRNVFVNRQASLALGLSKNYFPTSGAHAVHRLVHEQDLPKYLEHKSRVQALADGEITEVTYRMRHVDGSWRWFHGRDAPFERDPDGRVRLSIGTATDITAIKQTELAMRENNQRLDFVLAAANMGVWELNIETATIMWTEPLARLLGVVHEDAPTDLDGFLRLVHPDDRDDERRRVEEAVTNGSMYQSEFRMDLPEGDVRWMAGLGKYVRGEAGKSPRLLGLMWDITQRKQAEADRSRMEQQMRQSQKMEALGALAGGIAHDFNNILTAINGNARLALDDLPSDHPLRINIEEIHRGAMRATDLVSRILAFSRNEEPALRHLDLRKVVEEAVRLLRATMPAMIDIRFDQSGSVPPVLADATQIHQVIMNLGANARDAMGERGGVLTISLQETPIDSRLMALAPEIRGERCVRLTVEDTGIGMSPEDLDRIFEPFFTTKALGHGTGMGLAMVHGIVRRHGGVILASSQPGRGAKFELYFPAAVQPIELENAPARLAGVRGHGERILYVDDEEPLVFLASRMLTRLGFQVDGQTDPQQALRDFEQDPYRWDMIISDLGMPGLSGLDLAAELLRIRPDLPLMLTSGYVRLEDAERARMIGADDIVLKPNTIEDMAPIILGRLAAARDRRTNRTSPD